MYLQRLGAWRTGTMRTLEQRLDQLERSNRRYRLALGAGALAWAGLFTAGAALSDAGEVHDVLRTRQLEVVGDNGELYVWLGKSDIAPAGAVATYDEQGRPLCLLVAVAGPEGVSGAIGTFHSEGRRLVGLSGDRSGRGVIASYDEANKVRAVWPEGGGSAQAASR
jgi:hypothetical protein